MKRKMTALVTIILVLLTTSILIVPLHAQMATHNLAQERSVPNRDYSDLLIDEALGSGKLAFLYFYEENCYACRLQRPLIEELEREYSEDVTFIHVDGMKNRKAMAKFEVVGFPTILLIFGKSTVGYECKDFFGYTEKSLLKNGIESLASPATSPASTIEETDLHETPLRSLGLSQETVAQATVARTKPDTPRSRATYYCNDCADCNSKIASASPGDTVILTADIYNHVGSCIIMQNNQVTFDGDGHIIDGDGAGVDWGVGVAGGYQKNTVQNCEIMDFYYGIYVGDRADGWRILKNEVGGKTPNVHGISIWGAYDVLVEGNYGWNNQVGVFAHSNQDTIRGNELVGNEYGILLNGSSYNDVENNGVEENRQGIYLDSSDENSIRDNDANSNIENGISLVNSLNNTVDGNYANSNDIGIYLLNSDLNELTWNTANFNHYGIWLTLSHENQIVSNTANHNTGEPDSWGVRLEYDSNNNNVTLNTVSYNGGLGGLAFYQSHFNYIMNNTVTHNDYYGLWMRECVWIIVWGNTFNFNLHGIYLVETADFIWIEENNAEGNQQYGIRLDDCNYTYIYRNRVNTNQHGVYLTGESDLNLIQENQIVYNNEYGVYFESTSNNCTLSNNVICQNLVDIKDLDANSGDENTCNTPDGWNDDGTTGCTYSCPTGWCYDYTISNWINPPPTGDWSVAHIVECNDTSITLNGNLWISGELRFNNVHLMMNVTDMETLPPYTIEVDGGGAFLVASKGGLPSIIENGMNATAYYTFQAEKGSRFEMRDSELRDCGFAWNLPDYHWAGLWIATDNTIIEDSLIENNHFVGLFFYNSSYHQVTNNVIRSNDWYGIYGVNSTNNYIEGNEIVLNGQDDGISLSNAPNTIVTLNTISSNGQNGLQLSNAPNSTITDNTLNSNGWDGIALSSSPLSLIDSNIANSNHDDGISVVTSDETNVTHNTADHNSDEGILVSDSPGSLVADNYPDMNGDCGIRIVSSPHTLVTWNTANSNNHGIYISSSHYTQVTFNTANLNNKTTRHSTGIHIISSSHSTVISNVANSNWRGVYLEGSSNTTISENVFSSNMLFGAHLYLSPSNIFSENDVDGSVAEWDSAGLYLSNSEDNAIVHNEVTLSLFGMVLWKSPNAQIEMNNVTSNSKDGILLEMSEHSFIGFNNAMYDGDGIVLLTSDNVTIMNNTATNNGDGISLSGSDLAHIFNNLASDNSGTGISLGSSHYNSIHDNEADRNKYGISLSSSRHNDIFNNTATLNNFGISLRWSSNNNEVIDNDAKLCIDYGGNLFRSNTNLVIHNDFSSSSSVGIYLEQSDDNDIVNNTATSAANYGVNLFESDGNLLDNNDARFASDIGMELSSSNYNNLTFNIAEGSDVGFSIRFSNNNLIADNVATGNDIAFYLLSSSNNRIHYNEANLNNNVGIDLSLSDSNEILGNTVNGNPNYGIHLYSSEMNNLMNNTANMNGVGIYLDWSENNTITENTITTNAFAGIAIYWSSDFNQILHNEVHSNMNISIRISSANYNHVEGNNASSSGVGIFLDWAESNRILNNTANLNAYHGITLDWFSNNNEVADNSANGGLVGISMDMSSNNTVIRNNASLNDIGISLEWLSSENTVTNNTILHNQHHGLSFHWASDNNLVMNNVIGYNNEYGVYIHECIDNMIYHNEIVYNTVQAFSTDLNTWDDGYPSGGNYWSDYNGTDHNSGILQDQIGEDGIGDTPYLIDVGNTDRYPLMNSYTPQRILIYTDKYSYSVGNQMELGLHLLNLEDPIAVCVEIWLELPDSSTHMILHAHDVTIPAGLDYNNPSFRSFTLPSVTPGIYTWHATVLDPSTHDILVEDIAEWQFL